MHNCTENCGEKRVLQVLGKHTGPGRIFSSMWPRLKNERAKEWWNSRLSTAHYCPSRLPAVRCRCQICSGAWFGGLSFFVSVLSQVVGFGCDLCVVWMSLFVCFWIYFIMCFVYRIKCGTKSLWWRRKFGSFFERFRFERF